MLVPALLRCCSAPFDAAFAKAAVEAACIGRATCQLAASSEALGGDPCPGAAKALSVRARCVPRHPYKQQQQPEQPAAQQQQEPATQEPAQQQSGGTGGAGDKGQDSKPGMQLSAAVATS